MASLWVFLVDLVVYLSAPRLPKNQSDHVAMRAYHKRVHQWLVGVSIAAGLGSLGFIILLLIDPTS